MAMSYYPVVAYPESIGYCTGMYINCLLYMLGRMLGSGVLRFYVLHRVFRKYIAGNNARSFLLGTTPCIFSIAYVLFRQALRGC